MKKIKFGDLLPEEILSQSELKQISGGNLGSGSGGNGAGIHYCTATGSNGELHSTSADSRDPYAMNYLDAWIAAWQSLGGNPTCTFTPLYEV